MTKFWIMSVAALALAACGGGQESEETLAAEATNGGAEQADASEAEETSSADDMAAMSPEERLDAVLTAQSDETKARYQYRHPKATLMFFGVEPGMTVVDTLPGDPWYAGMLSEYLGPDGLVVGADYSHDMWTYFDGFADEEFLEAKETWTTDWVDEMEGKRKEGEAPFAAFQYGSLPEEMEGEADVVLMVRAAHHFNRLQDEGEFFTQALNDAEAVLKSGGVLGIVQHRGSEENSDEWAEGDNGYLKQSQVIAFVENAGFELVEASEINANPNDQAGEDDFVWRLPPSLGTSRDNPEMAAEMKAIGESDRMTLKFRKP